MVVAAFGLAALVAVGQAFMLGHVGVEPGERVKTARAVRAVITWFVEFVFIAEHGDYLVYLVNISSNSRMVMILVVL